MKDLADRAVLQDLAGEIFKVVVDGATVEQWAEWLRVPLEHAARKGDIDLVKTLMRSGANGSSGWRGGCDGGSLLGAGAVGGSEEVVIALLESGGKADLNIRLPEHGNGTPLHVAVARGAEGAARALMMAGAGVDAMDDQGRGPLHLAAESGQHGLVGDLLLRGARPEAQDIPGDTPLHIAAEKGHVQSVSVLLVSGADRNSLDGDARTPLYRAVQGNELQAAERLLAAGADVNHRSYTGTPSALDAAAMNGNLDMARLLTSNGADLSGAESTECTSLFSAVIASDRAMGNASVIRHLIEAGSNTEARPSFMRKRTALHYACGGTFETTSFVNARALLEGGADVNAQSLYGKTPLHFACMASFVDIVELLLRWGGNETMTVWRDGTMTADDGSTGRTTMDVVGIFSDFANEAKNDQIRRMLARAPADRSWRRRSWLIMCRSLPDRVSLTSGSGPTADSGKGRGWDDGLANLARTDREGDSRVEGEEGSSEGGEDDSMAGLRSVVARVVGLEMDGIFRKVVGYL